MEEVFCHDVQYRGIECLPKNSVQALACSLSLLVGKFVAWAEVPPQFEPVVARPRPDTLITETFAHAAMALRSLWKVMLHALL